MTALDIRSVPPPPSSALPKAPSRPPRRAPAGYAHVTRERPKESRVLKRWPTRMRQLDPIIARFVDDVLRLATEATRDSLRRLLGEAARQPWTRRTAGTPGIVTSASASELSDRTPEELPRPRSSPPVRGPGRRSALAIVTTDVAPPTAAAEITDPQWLLAMGSSAPNDVLDLEQPEQVEPPPESVSEAPASTTRDLGGVSPVRLRANETLARVSGAGVVIRRAR